MAEREENVLELETLTWIGNAADKVRLESYIMWSECQIPRPERSSSDGRMWQLRTHLSSFNLKVRNSKLNHAPLLSSHSRLLSLTCELFSIISQVSVPLGQLVSDRLHTHHTNTCERTSTHTRSLELIKIQPHLGLSNGPNSEEPLGALRVSGRLQDTHGLDRQVLGTDTPTPTQNPHS